MKFFTIKRVKQKKEEEVANRLRQIASETKDGVPVSPQDIRKTILRMSILDILIDNCSGLYLDDENIYFSVILPYEYTDVVNNHPDNISTIHYLESLIIDALDLGGASYSYMNIPSDTSHLIIKHTCSSCLFFPVNDIKNILGWSDDPTKDIFGYDGFAAPSIFGIDQKNLNFFGPVHLSERTAEFQKEMRLPQEYLIRAQHVLNDFNFYRFDNPYASGIYSFDDQDWIDDVVDNYKERPSAIREITSSYDAMIHFFSNINILKYMDILNFVEYIFDLEKIESKRIPHTESRAIMDTCIEVSKIIYDVMNMK